MQKEILQKIPPIFFILNTVEFFSGLLALSKGYLFLCAAALFLLAVNLIAAQIYIIRTSSRQSSLAAEDGEPPSPQLSSAFNEQLLELTRSNSVLMNENQALSEKLALCEKKLLAAPALYRCPLTSASAVNINKFLRSYYEQHQPDFSRAGLQSSLHIDTGSCETLLSKSALTLIFDNLLDNSLKYTPMNGMIVITLSKQENGTLLIWKNSGKGIAKADAAKVFDLNFHTNQAGHGTGLGLAQVKAIVDDFGGKAWAKTSFESGFTIFIEIPSSQKGAAL